MAKKSRTITYTLTVVIPLSWQNLRNPLYVYSVSEIREECQKIQAQFLTRYSKTRAAYAAKLSAPQQCCK